MGSHLVGSSKIRLRNTPATRWAQRAAKDISKQAFRPKLPEPEDPLRLSPLLRAPSGQVLEAVRKLGLEGIVGKRIGSIYEPGERSGAWIKHRTNREQDFVIGGYIPGSRRFDALLVGVYENKQLIFVAKVKDAFVPRIRDELFPALKKLSVVHCPFANLPEKSASRWGESLTAEKMEQCYWVKPKLVCQVAFLEWTDAGHKLRGGGSRNLTHRTRFFSSNEILPLASMVLDSEGSVLADTGARSLLESDPEVVPTPKREAGYDVKINIHPKEMIVGEPILESLDSGNVSVTARRIRGTAWEISVTDRADVITTEYQPVNLSPARYRLEIVPR
jgi:hypothetical protein